MASRNEGKHTVKEAEGEAAADDGRAEYLITGTLSKFFYYYFMVSQFFFFFYTT